MEVKREAQSDIQKGLCWRVSILVLMEVKREPKSAIVTPCEYRVSILVLMEVKREFNALNAEQIETILFQSLF